MLSEDDYVILDLHVKQGWGAYGPHGYLIWPASEFLLLNLEHKIMSKQSSMITRYQVPGRM